MEQQGIKQQIDDYIVANYRQLDSTTRKIIKKYNRHLDPSTVISHAYLYLIDNQQNIVDFSLRYDKTVPHIIYSFCIKYIKSSIYWERSVINRENDRLYNRSVNYDKVENVDNVYNSSQTDNIYTEDFIQDFYLSLDKLDGICFNIYYYAGIDNTKEFAKHFSISTSSAYSSINRLKKLLDDYIIKNKIH